MKYIFIFTTLALSNVVSSSELELGINIPLTGRDPFKVKNFHDVITDLDVIRNQLDETGGRLQEGQIAVFFSGFQTRSIILRICITNKEVILADISPNVKSNKWNIDLSNLDNEEFNVIYKTAHWISTNNKFDMLGLNCDCVPNIQVYVISTSGISIIEHAIHGSMTRHFLDVISVLMGNDLKTNNNIEAVQLVGKIKILQESFNNFIDNHGQLKPYEHLPFANYTSIVGETQETFEAKLRDSTKIHDEDPQSDLEPPF